jgi:sortase A
MKKTIGLLLVALSLAVVGLTFYPLLKNEAEYQIRQVQKTPITDQESLYPDFGIVIPKLAINAKVIPNIDPYNPSVYQRALTEGVAHAKGTALPGENGNIFIFSHSSENFYEAVHYNSIFYLLTKLEIGDKISLFYQGKQFNYFVNQKKIADPKDLSYLQNKTTAPTLTLMTCYPPGSDFKRFIVVAN